MLALPRVSGAEGGATPTFTQEEPKEGWRPMICVSRPCLSRIRAMRHLALFAVVALAGCSFPLIESPASDPELLARIDLPSVRAAWTDDQLGVTVQTTEQLDRATAMDVCSEVMAALDSFGPIWVIYGPGENDRLSCIA